MDFRSFELDDGQWCDRFALTELPQYGVGRFAGDFVMLDLVVSGGIFAELDVAERLSENLGEHLALHL